MKGIFYFLFSVFFSFQLFAQLDSTTVSADSTTAVEDSLRQATQDSLNSILLQQQFQKDSLMAATHLKFAAKIFDWAQKKTQLIFDVQQKRITKSNLGMFVVIMLLLLLLTYLKLAYSNDLEELWLSVSSGNSALQIFRTQTDSFSISSFLLTANFVLSMSFFIQFSAQEFLPSHVAQASLTTFLLIILFTSFLLLRTLLFRVLTHIFSLKETLFLYEFHFYRIVQTLGIAMLPAVLFMFAANKKYFVYAFAFACVCVLMSAVLLLVRGLSTSIKVVASNIKYFFIYVCVSEVAMVLLLIKLLTKIVS